MQHDKIINCPKSGGDLCYKVEINKDVTNYFSMSCGFWTNSLMKKGSQFFNEQWEILPELYKDLAWSDPETELIWLPNNVNVEEKGMVFADGTNKENWKWAGVKYVPVTEEDDEKYKDVKFKPDMSTIRHYEERDFMEALSYIGLLPE
jgi:ribosomal protein L1